MQQIPLDWQDWGFRLTGERIKPVGCEQEQRDAVRSGAATGGRGSVYFGGARAGAVRNGYAREAGRDSGTGDWARDGDLRDGGGGGRAGGGPHHRGGYARGRFLPVGRGAAAGL